MSRQRPQLRNGADLQLQSAFQNGNWQAAIRLAEKRARTSQNPYFEIVKICAESQLDDPTAKLAAVFAAEKFLKDGTVVKDTEALDLLEWATLDVADEDDFLDTLGPLRVRAAKASPKDIHIARHCLESCLVHWDLASAQQIAAMMHTSFPGERCYLFWGVVITHLLATSSQMTPEKRKLYGRLALKQIERAAQLTGQASITTNTDEPTTLPARGIQQQHEVLLLYEVVATHGSASDLQKLLASPVFSPVSQFHLGRKELLAQVLSQCHEEGNWNVVFNLCHDCLSDADENGVLTLQTCDWIVLRHFIDAAANLKSVKTNISSTVQSMLLRLAKSGKLTPIYRRNVLLARVLAAFRLGSDNEEDLKDGQPISTRLQELICFIKDQKTSSTCFDDVKYFVETLHAPAAKFIAYAYTERLADASSDQLTKAQSRLLSLKLQYLVSTSPPDTETLCRKALETYSSIGTELTRNATAADEIMPELAMVVAFCYLRMAHTTDRLGDHTKDSTSTKNLLCALFMLEHQLHLTPKHAALSLVLTQLHLFLGSPTRSREIWVELAVKRSIVNSMAPIFYDRLSTIAPSVISSSDSGGHRLMRILKSHYSMSLKLRMPRLIMDGLDSGNYGSVIGMAKYIGDLRASCTRAMSLVEEARTARLLGHTPLEVLNDARFVEVPDELCLNEVVAYGSFPSWDCSTCPPLYSRLQIGPPPSNERLHLMLLAEAFHSVFDYKPPSMYKNPTTPATSDRIDHAFVLEMMARLGHSFTKFLHKAAPKCTSVEMVYFNVVSLLCVLISMCGNITRAISPPDAFKQVMESLHIALDSLGSSLPPKEDCAIEHLASTLRSLHKIAIFRDTAAAVKMASRCILEFNEWERMRDQPGSCNLPAKMIIEVKKLQSAAETALKRGGEVIKGLKGRGTLPGTGFVSQLRAWVFEDEGALGNLIEDGTLSELVESWRGSVQGWQQVRWQ